MTSSKQIPGFSSYILKEFSLIKKITAFILLLSCLIACATIPSKTIAGKACEIQQQQSVIVSNISLMLARDRELFMYEYNFNLELTQNIMDQSVYYCLPLKGSAWEEYLTNTSENYSYLIRKYNF